MATKSNGMPPPASSSSSSSSAAAALGAPPPPSTKPTGGASGNGGGLRGLFGGGGNNNNNTGNFLAGRSATTTTTTTSSSAIGTTPQSLGASIASTTFAAATPLKAAANKMAANMRATLQPLGIPVGGAGGAASSSASGASSLAASHLREEKSEFLDSKPWYRSPRSGAGGGGSQRSAATSSSTETSSSYASSLNNNNNAIVAGVPRAAGRSQHEMMEEEEEEDEDEELNRLPTEKYLELYKNQPWILSHNLTSVTRDPRANPSAQANVGESAVSRMFTSLSSAKKKRPSTVGPSVARLQEEEGDVDDSRSVSSHYTANSSSTLQKPSTILPAVLAPVSLADFAPFFERTRTRTERFFRTHKESDFVVVTAASKQRAKPGENPKISKFNVRAGATLAELPEDPVAQLAKCYSTIPPHFFSPNYVAAGSVEVTSLIDAAEEILKRQRGRSNSSADDGSIQNWGGSTVEAAIQKLKEETANRLSDQMDLVEKSLWVQTTSKAEAIFQTVANLNALQTMVGIEGKRVATIRAHVSALRHATTHGRSNVLLLQRRRTNATSLMKTLEMLKKVLNSKAALEKMMASHDYTGAFTAIETAQYMLESPELTGVVALKTVSRQLREMKDLIGGEMAERFVKVATQAFDESGNFLGDESEEGDKKLKANLEPLIRGLMKKGNLKEALTSNRARLLELIKLTAKAVVTETLSKVPEGERSTALKNMEVDPFVAFLKSTFEAMETIQHRSKVVHAAVVETLQKLVATSGTSKSNNGNQQQSVTREEIKDAINVSSHVVLKIREATQEIAVRLLSFRDELHARLSMEDFAKVWEATQDFITTSGEPSTNLRVALTKQADMLLIRLDENLLSKLKTSFDADNWEAVFPVPSDIVQIVAKIENGSISSILSSNGMGGGVGSDAFFDTVVSGGAPAVPNVPSAGGARKVTVGTRQFKTTATGCVMIRNMQEYVRCALTFTPVAPRAAARCFDSIINFHETTKRLILGAEVKRTGKLQTIGAKHLALAWQCLSLILGLLPKLGKTFAEAVPSQQRTRVEEEKTRVQEALTSHSFQIINMLASLIKNELNASCGALDKDVDWDRRGTDDLDKPQKYMSDLIEKVGKLHQVISMHLDKEDVSAVFERVFIIINQRIPELFQVVRPKTPAGKTRVRVDIINLVSALRMLRGLQCTPGDAIETWLESKYGAAAQASSVVVSPAASNASTAAPLSASGSPTQTEGKSSVATQEPAPASTPPPPPTAAMTNNQ